MTCTAFNGVAAGPHRNRDDAMRVSCGVKNEEIISFMDKHDLH